ncbi:MAG: hypothetical protein A2Y38_24555 [Spirochaetes bacterium GWB1_59_5]|nr:MAG: hypothetical protein A2Y38_24555 [Spirochaetes bacterium GWB1_59_5]
MAGRKRKPKSSSESETAELPVAPVAPVSPAPPVAPVEEPKTDLASGLPERVMFKMNKDKTYTTIAVASSAAGEQAISASRRIRYVLTKGRGAFLHRAFAATDLETALYEARKMAGEQAMVQPALYISDAAGVNGGVVYRLHCTL